MTVTINFTATSLMAQVSWKLEADLERFNWDVLKVAKEFTPVDDWDLKGAWEDKWIQRQWTSLVAEVRNETEYARIVEDWVKWKTYSYNSAKWWPVFRTWVWAKMAFKAWRIMQDKIQDYF